MYETKLQGKITQLLEHKIHCSRILHTIDARKVKVKVKQLKSYPIRNKRNMKSINIPSFVSWDRPPTKILLKKGKNTRNFQIFYNGHVSALQYSEATRQEVKQTPFHSILKKGTPPKQFIPNIVSLGSSFHHFRV